MYAWGSNVNGQLGLQSGEVVRIMSQYFYVYLVERKETIMIVSGYIFGIHFLLLFVLQTTPKRVEEFEGHKIVAIATGDEFSLAVDEKGLPWVWGKGDKGQVRGAGLEY